MDNNNQDLAKQYQDILDHYSAELASHPPESPVTPENPEVSPEKPILETPEMITEKSPHGLPPEPEVNLPPIAPPPVKTYTISTPSEPPITPSQPSNIFKYLFFVSLLVFLGIFGSIIYTVISNSQNKDVIGNDEPTPTETISNVTPTVATGSVCEVNDKTYQKGESFTAADGCNSCVCGDDLTISCTEKSCEATPTAKVTPTIKISPTSKVTPTVARSIYTNSTYKYSFEYPSTWTLAVDPNSKDKEFSFNLPNNERVNGVVFVSTGAANRNQSTLKEFTLADNYQLLVTYVAGDELKSIPGSKDITGFKKFLSSFKLL